MLPHRFAFVLALGLAGAALSGCAVVNLAGATAGAVIGVAGAVVGTGVRVGGKVIEKTIDVAVPSGD
jgi:hypothetical protein